MGEFNENVVLDFLNLLKTYISKRPFEIQSQIVDVTLTPFGIFLF